MEKIKVADYEAVLAAIKMYTDVLKMENTFKKIIKMRGGDTPIAEALALL